MDEEKAKSPNAIEHLTPNHPLTTLPSSSSLLFISLHITTGGHPFNLEILHLGDNKLKSFLELDKISGWPLQELTLSGNPIREYLEKKDREVLVAAARKRFPKLKKLDNEEVPVEIGFDLESEEEQKKLPPSQKLYSSSAEALELIKNVS